MLSSISPLGEQARSRARRARWGVTAAAYLAGSIAGGAAVGALSAAVGWMLPATWRGSPAAAALLAALLLLGLALDLRVFGTRLPAWRRQVDEAWLTRYRGWVYGFGFGAQLGFGLVTIVTSSTVYAVAAFAALSGDLRVGAALGLTFGVVRALPVLASSRVRDRDRLHAMFRALERWEPLADRAAHVALVLTAAGLAAASLA
jgi:MFS family permease